MYVPPWGDVGAPKLPVAGDPKLPVAGGPKLPVAGGPKLTVTGALVGPNTIGAGCSAAGAVFMDGW